MSYPTERDLKKRSVVRRLAAFILLCSFLATAGLASALITESFELLMLVGVAVIGFIVHVVGSIVLEVMHQNTCYLRIVQSKIYKRLE